MHRILKYTLPVCGMTLLTILGCRTTEQAVERPQTRTTRGGWNLEGASPHLVAHYMPWFEVNKDVKKAATAGKPIASRLPSSWYDDDRDDMEVPKSWRHWKWDNGGPIRDPEQRREDGLRKIASVSYPLIGPYNSRSRDVMRYHLRTAKAAGIQAFIVDWYGPGSFEDQQIPILLDEARKAGMKIAICYEEKINFQGFRDLESRDEAVAHVVDDLTYILESYAGHEAYLKRDGIPFVAQFNGWGKGPAGPSLLTPPEWRDVFGELPAPLLYGRQNLDEEYYPPIEAGYVWWNSDLEWLKSVAQRAVELRKKGRLEFFMSMICPGFDDTGVWGWGHGPRKHERDGLTTLKKTFEVSALGEPELVQIVTWNDFNEGTVVEPTRENGYEYLDALETWWGDRTGRPVDLEDNRRPFLDYVSACSSQQTEELPKAPFDSLLAPRSPPPG